MNLNDYIVNIILPEDLFDIACSNSKNLNEFRRYSLSFYDPNKLPGPDVLLINDELKNKLENLVGNKCVKAAFILLKPNHTIIPHIDRNSNSHRKSCLTWALNKNYNEVSPTLFYDKNDKVIAAHHYDARAFIIDTRIRHGVVNNDKIRIMLQMMFDMEPLELKRIIESNLK
jgi:hypothetical protein